MCDDFTGGKETVLVYKASFRGSFLISAHLNDILDSLKYDCEDMEDGERVIIRKIKMSQKKYEALPDFEGF